MFKFLQKSGASGEAAAAPQHILDALYAVVESRKGPAPDGARTAKPFAKGTAKIGQKVGEEAAEGVIGGLLGGRERLLQESGDLPHQHPVPWARQGGPPEAHWGARGSRPGR